MTYNIAHLPTRPSVRPPERKFVMQLAHVMCALAIDWVTGACEPTPAIRRPRSEHGDRMGERITLCNGD